MTDQHSLTSDPVATPETDTAEKAAYEFLGRDGYVIADFARAQERRIDQLEEMRREISELISGHEGHVFDDITNALLSVF